MSGRPFSASDRSRIDEIVAAAVVDEQAPGVVAGVARGDGGVHVSCAGSMAVDGPAMQRDTVFRIASVTKPMTAATVLSLIEDGLLTLEEPVERLLPELADRRVLRRPDGLLDDTVPAQRPFTVRDLLTFTWGFGMQGAMFTASEPWPIVTAAAERELSTFNEPRPASTPPPDVWLARLAELPLLVQPGEKWLYQSGAQVLGVLASRAAGAPFADVMREQLFGPLGMRDTAFHVTDITRLATAYARRDSRLEIIDPPGGQWSRQPAFADGGAGLVSTVDDVIAFGRMLLGYGERVLAPDTITEMTRDQLTSTQRVNEWPGFDLNDGNGWGYGVSVADDGRYFWDGGLGTTWSNVPEQDLTVVVLTQRAWDETGPPAVCADVLAAARAAG